MTKAKKQEAVQETKQDENVEITFDFEKVDLFELLEVLEYSATMADGSEQNDPGKFAKFLRVMRTAYVSSSRPLTGTDFQALSSSFWRSVNLSKNPNS